ncbi:dockerin type I repeat-containing protein [Methanoculleus taiwanensis]|uniref:dockerin type I repeat-containing protein n=1 Tax=Methanoculleus taiwanensis TaxID=1550565 RepID=UPI0013E8D40D|nr:dockerin type I repeat-containing protein [Methanoculleus taiwanensis]
MPSVGSGTRVVRKIVLLAIGLCIGMACTIPVAAVPSLPAEFSGTVLINGESAPAGTVVVALLGGEERGRIVTVAEGVYGGQTAFDRRLLVQALEGDIDQTVGFTVNGVGAAETAPFSAGVSRRCNLTAFISSLTVTVPSGATPVIPTDTDGVAGHGEAALLAVTVTGSGSVQSAMVDLSSISRSSTTALLQGGGNAWSVNATSAVPSAFENGTYRPFSFTVHVTDTNGYPARSVSLPLIVVKNGDANENNRVTLYDAVYIARHYLGSAGFASMHENVGDVTDNGAADLADAMYLAKHILGIPGFEVLR